MATGYSSRSSSLTMRLTASCRSSSLISPAPSSDISGPLSPRRDGSTCTPYSAMCARMSSAVTRHVSRERIGQARSSEAPPLSPRTSSALASICLPFAFCSAGLIFRAHPRRSSASRSRLQRRRCRPAPTRHAACHRCRHCSRGRTSRHAQHATRHAAQRPSPQPGPAFRGRARSGPCRQPRPQRVSRSRRQSFARPTAHPAPAALSPSPARAASPARPRCAARR